MQEKDIRKYAQLMQDLGLSALEINEEKNIIRLERNTTPPANESVVISPTLPTAPITEQSDGDYISVTSPIVGIFYSAPSETSEPYVSIGTKVSKGQVLCIVEAMKLMNEVTSEYDGVISDICVTNGQIVEFGTELFRIKR